MSLKVRIYVELPNGEEIAAWREFSLNELKHRPAFDQIDFPTTGISAIFCTPKEQAQLIKLDRKRVADELTKFIVDSLGKRDLVDGYPKDTTNDQ